MLKHDREVRSLAACLSAVAGYVDALGFLAVGGFFVSFMSGNTTRLGVGVAGRSVHAAIAAGLIFAFVVGVVAGSLVGRFAVSRRRFAILAFVAAMLALAAVLGGFGETGLAVGAMALAMGAENAVFERDGEVSIGLTYITGTLVKVGQRIAGALAGADPFAWAPYLMLWAALATGAVAGAAVYPLVGLQALWAAVAAIAVMAMVADRVDEKPKAGP
jgi:uncharacterized membrane protein YoaK (UPF0700 family)